MSTPTTNARSGCGAVEKGQNLPISTSFDITQNRLDTLVLARHVKSSHRVRPSRRSMTTAASHSDAFAP
jgi:hypothetical protein